MKTINTIIFDLGGVLIDWNPEYVYLDVFKGDREKMQWFFEHICTSDWNEEQDAGRPLKTATEERIALFPEHEELIRMYYGRWEEMLGGPIDETVSLLKSLFDKDSYEIYALTNWSAETFPVALERYEFLHWFKDIVVSGAENTRKPFKEIYDIAIDRFNIKPENTLFIDDNQRNIEGAEALGINGIRFTSASDLKTSLNEYGITL
ncbi:HAD-IA family hydrolase [Leptobacterium flavescens]|uniref:HAD-IA family hydrolase n=1 Tax=Leptobacterium flavescens TaxID=472055 RepID=A0A6P0UKM8_9FLAO|nr:HAD family phosphatase [Leptobacterium flavescens]NER13845.1 HAD-IA family hydrolase [Leptobacterium flavescens]